MDDIDAIKEKSAEQSGVAAQRELARLKAERDAWRKEKKQLLEELELSEKRAELFEELSESAVHWRKWGAAQPGIGGNTSAVLVLTDWHVEERVDRSTTNGINEYTPKIAEARARRCVEKFLRLLEWARSFAEIEHVVVALLGDFISGYIHEELQETNWMSPVEATLLCRDLLASAISSVAADPGTKSVDVVTCNGNHGRTTQKRRVKTYAKNSYEWGMYHGLAREFAGTDVKFRIGEAYHNWLKIQGHDVRFHHGDNIRYGGGVGGISIPVNKAVAAWNKQRVAALDVFGHWHQTIEHHRWVSCPCLVGHDEFAISIKAEYEPPAQMMILVSKKHGKVVSLPIFVE